MGLSVAADYVCVRRRVRLAGKEKEGDISSISTCSGASRFVSIISDDSLSSESSDYAVCLRINFKGDQAGVPDRPLRVVKKMRGSYALTQLL